MAMLELVKNAYDADASTAVVSILPFERSTGGSVEIRDDGSGMSLETILGAWLQPATDYKRRGGRKQRTERGRYPLGEKGVGRFAADKLGAELELVSRTYGDPQETRLRVSWDSFSDDVYL